MIRAVVLREPKSKIREASKNNHEPSLFFSERIEIVNAQMNVPMKLIWPSTFLDIANPRQAGTANSNWVAAGTTAIATSEMGM